MEESWILISYGDFNITKKLFSYDRFGLHTLPIFKDPIAANEFVQHVKDLYKNKKDFRLNYVENKQRMIDILNLITMATFDLEQVIIDPIFANASTPERFSIGEHVIKIDKMVEQLSS